MAFDIEKVREIVERVARSSGLEVVEVELRGGGKARMLRLVIDRPGGVTHEDCASMSREVGTILDVEDVMPGANYTLEVSSPGLDRKLSKAADFERFAGSRVKLTTYAPVDGERRFEGKLEAFAEGKLSLDVSPAKKKPKPKAEVAKAEVAAKKIEIELANVEKANLVPEF
jgi:ribosome maturation factor RimP